MTILKLTKAVKSNQKSAKGNDIFAMLMTDVEGKQFYTTFEVNPNFSEGIMKSFSRMLPIDGFKVAEKKDPIQPELDLTVEKEGGNNDQG